MMDNQNDFELSLTTFFTPSSLPKILETPWYGEKKDIAPYKDEIAMLRKGEFVDFKN